MVNKLKKIFIFGLIITLPVSILYAIWLTNTLSLYYQSNQLLPTWGMHLKDFNRIGFVEYLKLKNTIISMLGQHQEIDANILIEEKYLNQLNHNLPESGSEEKKAFLIMDNRITKGKVKLRGDNFYHWLYPYKSWRFKTSKKNLIADTHKLNFIIPKHHATLNNQLSYKLAKELDLLSPESKIINLYINGHFNGIKLMAEQIDESFLRKNNRMPNDIYKGDDIGSKKTLGVTFDLFETPSVWNKASYNNHYSKNSKFPLEKLLLDKDYSLLDIKNFAHFSLFIDLINTYHYDDTHNWIFYYDHYFEKMYPIIWDPLGWHNEWEDTHHVNIVSSHFMKQLYSNYNFLYLKYDAAYKFSNIKEKFIHLIDQEIQIVKNKVGTAGYTLALSIGNMNYSEAVYNLTIFKKKVLTRLDRVEDYFVGEIDKNNYRYSLKDNMMRLSVNSSKMIKKIIIKAKDLDKLNDITINYIIDGKKIRKSLKSKLTLESDRLIIDQKLLAKIIYHYIDGTPWYYANFAEASYDIEFDGLDANNISDVSLEFLNLKNQKVTIDRKADIEQKEFKNVSNIIQEDINSSPIVWSGSQYFSGFNVIKNDIIIKAGTQLIFDENTSVKILGKVTAIGTKQHPIIFKAKDKSRPWNTFVIKDQKANGSIFKHCIFKDGSGDKGDLYEYTAMFSVHNVKDLLVENCKFYDSHKTDDMVHVIYSDAVFKNTKFIRSLSDALDVDISNVLVDNCEFIDSGNDAIDLMTTNAVVVNTKFIHSADKGISIGEKSSLLAINNVIKNNAIGMQSKDSSKAYIYNTSFIENKKAVDAYHKNWRYSSGGTIHLQNCLFESNNENVTVGKKSKVMINASQIDTANKFDQKSLYKKKIIISHDELDLYDLSHPLFKNKSSLINKNVMGYYE
jgi:hypothetical protein